MAAEWLKQALSAACSGFAGYMKELTEQTKLNAEEKRKYNAFRIKQQQQTMYQQPIVITLDGVQIHDILNQLNNYPCYTSANLMLNQQQVRLISNVFVQQAINFKDKKTLSALRNVLIPGGLGFNLSFLKEIHKKLFDDFISAYNRDLTYAACTPPGGLFFVIAADGFGFCYNISLMSPRTLKHYQGDFKRFSSTGAAMNLFQQYVLQYNKISYTETSKNLIIFFR